MGTIFMKKEKPEKIEESKIMSAIIDRGEVTLRKGELYSLTKFLSRVQGREVTERSLSRFGESIKLENRYMHIVSTIYGKEAVIVDLNRELNNEE